MNKGISAIFKNIFNTLFAKIFLTIFLGTMATVAAIGFSTFIFVKAVLQKSIMSSQLETAAGTMDKIDRILYERYSNIQQIAGEDALEDFLNHLSKSPQAVTQEERKKILKRLKELTFLTGPWDTLFVVNTQGKFVISTNEKKVGEDVGREVNSKMAYERAMKGEIYYSDLILSDDTGRPTIVFAAPIRNEDDPARPIEGVVIGNFMWPAIVQVLEDMSMSAILVNKRGEVIGHNMPHALENSLLRNVIGKDSMQESRKRSMIIPTGKGILPQETLTSTVIEDGYLSYKGMGWGLVLSQPTSIVFAFADWSAFKIVMVLIPMIFIMGAGILFMTNRFVSRPIAGLSQTIQKIAQGDFGKQAMVTSSDEIGQLAAAFNAMTARLRESYQDLENKVARRTKDLTENESRLRSAFNDLQKTHEELKQVQMQLLQSEKLASIGQLAAGVAHEINNPVGFISNNMELLGQYVGEYTKILRMLETLKKSIEEGDMEKAKSIVKEISQFEKEIQLDHIMDDTGNLLQHNQRGIERIQKIVMDLRTFARGDNDAMDFVKIEEVIDSILSIVHSELKYKVELKKNYGDTPLVKCNAQRLGQVFINLFVNAAQAIEEKGTIEVRTYRQGKYVCVDVSDTGKGIAPENLKKIFDPFFTTKPIGQGTGLGLSVSYEIIKKYGGEIKVQSKVGEGTTFTVMLPVTS